MPKQVFTQNKACLRKAKSNLEKHQMGFDGEHIGQTVIAQILKRKGVKLTRHKHKFDVLTAKEAWEVKTVGKGSKYHQMSVKADQKLKKLAWAKKNKKKAKSMLVLVNDVAEVYVKNGLGKFTAGGMKRVKTYKNWRKDVGHGRVTRVVEGRTIEQMENWILQNIEGVKNVSLKGLDSQQIVDIIDELSILQRKYGRLGRLNQIEAVAVKDFSFAARMQAGRNFQIRVDQTSAIRTRLVEAGIEKSKKGLAGLIDHEIGHTMTPDVFTQKGKFTAFGKRLDDFFEKNKLKIEKEMTVYASSARHEFVAEAFAIREAETAPKWVLDWLRKEGI